MLMVPLQVLLLLITVAHADNTGVDCSQFVYASTCAAQSECTYCCSAPLLARCQSKASSGCPASHRVEDPQTSCADLCPDSNWNASSNVNASVRCHSCVSKLWCYYCEPTEQCVAPTSTCPEGGVLQTCSSVISGSGSSSFSWGSSGSSSDSGNLLESSTNWKVLLIVSGCLVALVVLALIFDTFRRLGVFLAFRALLRAEAAPLLPPGGNGEEGNPPRPVAAANQQDGGDAAPPAAVAAAGGGEDRTASSDDDDDDEEEELHDTSAAAAVAVQQPNEQRNTTDAQSDGSNGGICQVCYDADAVMLFLPCHHMHCCVACTLQLRPSSRRVELNCPFCRQRVGGAVLVSSITEKR